MKMMLLLYLKAWERLFSFILLFCYFFLVTCDISLFSRSVQVTKNLPPSELTALSNFYISLNGPNWHWFNESATIPWNFSVPNPNPCLQKWQGLSCNCLSSPSYCYLDEINLPLHNLSGIFPQSVGTFTSLTRLALLRNNITGSIPTAVIANLTSLTTLDLRNNLLYGPIPWNINKIANLQVLSLENNFFEGPLPRNLFRLKALKALLLQYNMLNGTLSSAISDLKQLQELALSLNHFTGTLPIGIGNLTHLQDLEIKFNRLHGPIPRTIGLLTNLSNLAFSGNNLSQSIPFEIGNLTQLKSLNLDQNRLTGSLPGSLGNLTKLFQLYINNNLVFGSLPVAMFNSDVKVLTTVSLGSNLITGKLPSEISHWARTLQFFSLSRNRMTGSFPTESFSNASLRVLSMNFNFFYGAFPNNSFPNGTVLIDIDIGGNSFSGSPPSNHWPVLAYYLAYDNYFDGVISPLFHTSSRLYYFEISHNFLTGIVPDWVSRSILLTYLNFTDNLLTGPLNYTFSEITHATHLQQISLGHNFLTGTIPRALGRATTLVDIILNDNQISGTIPQTFRDLRDLEVLFLQNNHISGNLYNFRVYSLVNFDVSNNQLTGTLPDFTFIAPSLKTFAASSNCIDGTISDNICTISSFTLLALDGLSTATKCRTKFFPSSRFFNGFYVNSYIKNGIPDCLFTMPNLQTLQLSGNGLTGSLPSNMNLSNSLTDLSLSHNQLTGTIPLYIQEREWTNLDLSYNKLGGILSNDFHSYDDESSLSLEINRLSGNIPNVLRSAQNINILQGNLFTCNSDRSALPSHDKSVDTYSCGSDIVNATIYLWLGVFFIFLVMLNLLLRGAARLTAKVRELQRRLSIGGTSCHTPDAFPPMPMVDEVIHNIVQWRKTIAEFQDPDENVQIAVQSIRVFLRPLRRYAVRLAFFVTVVLTPIYLALTLQYRSYYYSYAWSISAVFVSGRISAITMCVPLIVLIFIAVHFYRTMVENPSNTVDENYRTSRRFRRFLQSIKNLRSEDRWLTTSVLILVGAINFLLMLIVDVVYVYIVLTYSTAVIILTEACLAMFKLWFNNQLLWKAIPWAKMRLKGCFQVNVEQRPSVIDNRHLSGSFELSTFQTHNPMISSVEDIRLERAKSDSERSVVQESSSASSIASRSMTLSAVLPSYHAKETVKSINAYTYSLTELIFIMVTIVFNNVLLPMLAIFIVNPDCFFNSLFAASTETVSYNYVVCDRFSNLAHLCLTRIVLTEDSSYTPPFIYGYQCASNVLTNYIPVFIIMFTFEGFLHPLLKIILKLSSDKLFYQEYFLKQHQSPPNPLASLKPLSVMEEGNNAEQKEDSGIKSIAFNRFSTRQVLAKSSPLYRLVIFLLPANMQDLTPFPPNDGPPILFDKNRLAVKINSALVVLIAFGAPFPPLAIIICVSLITLTLFEEIVIGRLLFESQKLGYLWYKKQIERDCYGIAHTLKYTLWSLVPVSSLLFAYIIFDTWGDQEGWASALPATIITGILPIIYLIFVKYYDAIVEKVALLSKQKDDLDANNDEVALHEKKTDVTDESGGSLASRPLPTLPANILDELIRTDDEEITNSPSLGNNELSIQSDHDETKNSPLPSNRNLDCQIEDV